MTITITVINFCGRKFCDVITCYLPYVSYEYEKIYTKGTNLWHVISLKSLCYFSAEYNVYVIKFWKWLLAVVLFSFICMLGLMWTKLKRYMWIKATCLLLCKNINKQNIYKFIKDFSPCFHLLQFYKLSIGTLLNQQAHNSIHTVFRTVAFKNHAIQES